jgi:pyruvate ferredoxin oxidoreductase beta subunit
MQVSGKDDVRVIAHGGDGATTDIGMGALSGMFDRNDDVLYICYDNQAYMNTGVQRSSATPPLTRTATTLPNDIYVGGDVGTGKNVPEIAMAHHIPYVATASIANIFDLEKKIVTAIHMKGSRYISIHAPCPLGWGHAPAETIGIARMAVECGLFPLFEARDGVVVASTAIENIIPVEEYLRPQRRFAHLLGKSVNTEAIGYFQNLANRNIEKYRLDMGVTDV